jgi:flagellar basal-body rod protein FlgC
MSFRTLFHPVEISSSGLTAERQRLEVTANNIANASSTRTPQGGPFRRQDVVFAAVMDDLQRPGGVVAEQTVDDPSEFPVIYKPGHPDADEQGFLRMPNVQLPVEMVNLITASRSYEANVRAAQAFEQMSQQALALLRG